MWLNRIRILGLTILALTILCMYFPFLFVCVSQHTTIVVAVLIELLLVFHRFPTTRNAVAMLFSLSTAYIIWIVVIVSVADFWVYPFLKVMPPPVISVFFVACFFAVLGIYFLGQLVGHWRWRERHLLIEELKL
jgi:hypothetical protein